MSRAIKFGGDFLVCSVVLSVSALCTFSSSTFAASFNCAKASTYVEKTVCEVPALSELDERLANAYKKALAISPNKAKTEQIAWLKLRNECKDAKCIHTSYSGRISELEQGNQNATPGVSIGPGVVVGSGTSKTVADQKQSPSKNFLIGLCEIPPTVAVEKCSRDALVNSDGGGSFQVFFPNHVKHVLLVQDLSSNARPRAIALDKQFDVRATYRVDEANSSVTAYVGDEGKCIVETTFRKTSNGIQVTRGALSGNCGEYERSIRKSQNTEYSMKYRTYTP